MYRSQAYVKIDGGQVCNSLKLENVSVWSTDDEGSGKLVLQSDEATPVEEYLVCEREAVDINFRDMSTLACNFTESSDENSYSYNLDMRHTQFAFGVTNVDGDLPPNVSVGGHLVTTGAALGPGALVSGVYETAVQSHTPIAKDQTMSNPTPDITIPANMTVKGQRFTIELRNWNVCNPQPGAPVTTTASILVTETPHNPKKDSLEFCHSNHYSSSNDGKFTHTVTHVSPLNSTMTGGNYIWYNDDSGSPGNAVLKQGTSATFNPVTDLINSPYRLNAGTPGHYDYWVRYTKVRSVSGQSITCQTDLVKIRWTVRNDISAAPGEPTSNTGKKEACPDESITFSYPAPPAAGTYGGNTVYKWEYSLNNGSTWTAAASSGDFTQTTDGESATITLRNTGTAPITYRIRVHREWVTPISNPTPTGCRYSYTGSNCNVCPGAPTTFDVVANPKPRANLTGGGTICPDETINLNVNGLYAKQNSSTPYYRVHVKLNNSQEFDLDFATLNATVNSAVTVNPLNGTATRYTIAEVKDRLTGCINTGTGYADVYKRAPLGNAPTFSAQPGNDLCAGKQYTWTASALPSVTLTGTNPPANQPQTIEYKWTAWNTDLNTPNTDDTYTLNSGTAAVPNGTSQSISVVYRYSTPAAQSPKTGDAKYCPSPARTHSVTVIPVPAAVTVPSSQTICNNGDATVSVTLSGVANSNWGLKWRLRKGGWTTLTPAEITGIPGTANGQSANYSITIPNSAFADSPKDGAYTFEIASVWQERLGESGCPGSITNNAVTVNVRKVPSATLDGIATICEKAPYTIPSPYFTLSGDAGGTYTVTFHSDKSGGMTQTVSGLAAGDGLPIPASMIEEGTATTEIAIIGVKQTVSGLECTGSAGLPNLFEIRTQAAPNAGPDQSVCSPTLTITMNATSTPGGHWELFSTNPAGLPTPSITPDIYALDAKVEISSGIYVGVYTYVWKSNASCTDTVVLTFENPAEQARIDKSVRVVCGNKITLTGSTDLGALQPWETGTWSLHSAPSGATIISPSNCSVESHPLGTGQHSVPAPTITCGIHTPAANIEVSEPGVYVFRWEVKTNCSYTVDSIKVTFKQIPKVTQVADFSLCEGDTIPVTFEDTDPSFETGIVYRWEHSGVAGGPFTDNPAGIIAPIQVSPTDLTYTISVTPSKNGCTGDVMTFRATAIPKPRLNPISDQTLCPRDEVTLELNPSLINTTGGILYEWKGIPSPHPNAGVTDGSATVSASPHRHVLKAGSNNTPAAQTGQIGIVATVRGCQSDTLKFDITVKPQPVIHLDDPDKEYCPDTNVDQADMTQFSSTNLSAADFTWSYTGGSVGFDGTSQPAVSTGTPDFYTTVSSFTTSSNISNDNYKGTVTLTAAHDGCDTTGTFTVTVKPKPVIGVPRLHEELCASSGSSDVRYFQPIVPAPTAGHTYSPSYSFVSYEGLFPNDVTAALGIPATAASMTARVPESNGGQDSIMLVSITPDLNGCKGDSVTVELVAHPLPVVDVVSDQKTCAGMTFGEVPFSSNLLPSQINYYTYKFDAVNVGLGANAGANSSSVPSFTAFNNTGADDIVSEVSVTARSNYGCVSASPMKYKYVVYPKPVIQKPLTALVGDPAVAGNRFCPGDTVSFENFQTQITKSVTITYDWHLEGSYSGSIGMNPSYGSGSGTYAVPGFKAADNLSGANLSAPLVMKATSSDGCVSTDHQFTLVLLTAPRMNPIANRVECPLTVIPGITFSANVALSSNEFKWKLDSTEISGGGGTTALPGPNTDQIGNIPTFTTHENYATKPITGNFMVWAALSNGSNTCMGDTVRFSVKVKPTPDVKLDTIPATNTVDRFYCPEEETDIYSFKSSNAGVFSYRWSYDTEIGLNRTGSQIGTYVPSFTARNQGNSGRSTLHSQFIVQSVLDGCYSDTARFTMTVGPMPQVKLPSDTAVCAGEPVFPKAFQELSDNWNSYYNYHVSWNLNGTGFPELQQFPLGGSSIPAMGNGNFPAFVGDTSHNPAYTNPHPLWGVTPKKVEVEVKPQYIYQDSTPLAKTCVNPNLSYMHFTINPLPITKIMPPSDKCVQNGENKLYQVYPSDAVGSSYQWDIEDLSHQTPAPGSGAPTISPYTGNGHPLVVYEYPNPAKNWEGYISVIETNAFGCKSDTMYERVSVITAPVVFAGNDTTVCSGEVMRLNGKLISPYPAPPNFNGSYCGGSGCISYEWFPGTLLVRDGSKDAEDADDDLSLKPRVLAYSNIKLTLRAQLDGCYSKWDTINISVGRTPNIPVIPEQTYCQTVNPMQMTFLSDTLQYPNDSVRWFRGEVNPAMMWTGVYAKIPTANDRRTVNMLSHTGAIPSPPSFTGTNDEAVIRYGVYMISDDGCVSDTALATMRIRKVPETPMSDTTEYCRNGMTSFMLDAKENVRWYPDSIYPPNPSIPGTELFTGRYYNANNISVQDISFFIKKQAPNGCWSYYAEKKLRVHDNPAIHYTITDSIGCADLNTTLTNLATDPDVTYIVNWGDSQSDTILHGQSIGHTYYNNTAYSAIMQFYFNAISKTDSSNVTNQYCFSNKSMQVVAFPKVQATINASQQAICDQSEVPAAQQQRIQLSVQGNGTNFVWSSKDGTLNSTQRNVDHVFSSSLSSPDKYQKPDTITVTLEAGTGQNYFNGTPYAECSVIQTSDIVIWPVPRAEFTYTDMDGNPMPAWICSPNNVKFDNLQWDSLPWPNNGVNGDYVRYEWSVDGSPNTGIDTTYRFNNVGFTARTIPLVLTATNTLYGCRDEDIRSIQVMPRLSVDFSISQDNGCAPLTVELVSESIGARFNRWFWDVDHKPLASGDGVTHPLPYTKDTVIHTFTNSSVTTSKSYHVWLRAETGTSIAQCYMWKDTVINVWPVPLSGFSVTPVDMIYPNSTVNIANLVPPGADRANVTYRWELLKQGSSTPLVISGATEPGGYTIGDWGTFTLTQYATAQDGHCPTYTSKEIRIVPPNPIASFDSVPPGCSPLEVQFHNTSQNSYQYLWDFGDGQTSALENPMHRYEDPGYYIVTLVARGDAVNPDITTRVVLIDPVPNAAFLVKPEFMWVNQTAYTFNLTSHITPAGQVYDIWYKWDFGDGTDIDTLAQPEHVYRKTGKFDVTLTVGTYGDPPCTTTRTIVQAVEVASAGDIIFPNTFRPDPNGEPSDVVPSEQSYRNYLFFAPVLQPTKDFHLSVYNRWGQMIFQTNDPTRGWTGYYKGQLCPEGVYVYRAWGTFTNGQSFQKRGDILLMR